MAIRTAAKKSRAVAHHGFCLTAGRVLAAIIFAILWLYKFNRSTDLLGCETYNVGICTSFQVSKDILKKPIILIAVNANGKDQFLGASQTDIAIAVIKAMIDRFARKYFHGAFLTVGLVLIGLGKFQPVIALKVNLCEWPARLAWKGHTITIKPYSILDCHFFLHYSCLFRSGFVWLWRYCRTSVGCRLSKPAVLSRRSAPSARHKWLCGLRSYAGFFFLAFNLLEISIAVP